METDKEDSQSQSELQEGSQNLILSLRWIRQGVANPLPEKVHLSKVDLENIVQETTDKLSNYEMEESRINNDDEYNLSNYDNDGAGASLSSLGIQSLIDLPKNDENNFSDSDDSDKADDLILRNDNLVLCGHVDDGFCLDVYIYNEDEGSLYVHHDLVLPSYPLCLEWLNYEPTCPKGNYCAIGSLDSVIEVYDIDIMNCIEPAFHLGKVANKKKKRAAVGHTLSVLALAWNETFEHIMASGSADKTVLLWDMENQTPSNKFTMFGDIIQSLKWHENDKHTLLAGCNDKIARLIDCRTPDSYQGWTMDSSIEKVLWNPQNPNMFLVGTDIGTVVGVDYRKGNLWSLDAHEENITGITISEQCPGLLLTADSSGPVNIWDFTDENKPTLVHEHDFGVGRVNAIEICPDNPFVISLGGDNKQNNFVIYNLLNIDTVKNTFGSRDLLPSKVANTGNSQSNF